MDYVLITPVKNEAKILPASAECILHQTRLPVIWVILDGGSTDGTGEIAENLAKSNAWIELKEQENFSDIGGHINFSLAVREAYRYIQDVADQKGISYTFIGKLDADQFIPPNFFEYLIDKFRNDPELGVVSGAQYTLEEMQFNWMIDDERVKPDRFPDDELPDKRLYRRAAIDEIGGFPVTKYSPDSVILAKLRMKGWKIRAFPGIKVINFRKDSGIERDIWKSSIQFGKTRYYLGYHPYLLLMSCGYVLLNAELVKACGIFFGYLISFFRKEEIIDDENIRTYFRYKRIREIFDMYGKKYFTFL